MLPGCSTKAQIPNPGPEVPPALHVQIHPLINIPYWVEVGVLKYAEQGVLQEQD